MTEQVHPEIASGNVDKPTTAPTTPTRKISGAPTEGVITQTIGTGDNAKNSFVWLTIRWSFILGASTTLAIYGRHVCSSTPLPTNLLDDIKSTWSIFIPIITLALGYAFGKGK